MRILTGILTGAALVLTVQRTWRSLTVRMLSRGDG